MDALVITEMFLHREMSRPQKSLPRAAHPFAPNTTAAHAGATTGSRGRAARGSGRSSARRGAAARRGRREGHTAPAAPRSCAKQQAEPSRLRTPPGGVQRHSGGVGGAAGHVGDQHHRRTGAQQPGVLPRLDAISSHLSHLQSDARLPPLPRDLALCTPAGRGAGGRDAPLGGSRDDPAQNQGACACLLRASRAAAGAHRASPLAGSANNCLPSSEPCVDAACVTNNCTHHLTDMAPRNCWSDTRLLISTSDGRPSAPLSPFNPLPRHTRTRKHARTHT